MDTSELQDVKTVADDGSAVYMGLREGLQTLRARLKPADDENVKVLDQIIVALGDALEQLQDRINKTVDLLGDATDATERLGVALNAADQELLTALNALSGRVAEVERLSHRTAEVVAANSKS